LDGSTTSGQSQNTFFPFSCLAPDQSSNLSGYSFRGFFGCTKEERRDLFDQGESFESGKVIDGLPERDILFDFEHMLNDMLNANYRQISLNPNRN
jgi:hypothetical protein